MPSTRWLFPVSTFAYEYRLNDDAGRELAAWHWHPAPLPGPDFPHLHAAGTAMGHAHLPTGRVSIESVLRLLLGDLGVPARRPDHAAVLDAAERRSSSTAAGTPDHAPNIGVNRRGGCRVKP